MKVKFYTDLNEDNFQYNEKWRTGQDSCSLMAQTTCGKLYEGYERIEFTVDIPDRFFKAEAATITAKVSDVQMWGEEAKMKDLS
jgi:hypothetical protein